MSAIETISGHMSHVTNLSGKISLDVRYPTYEGMYTITPSSTDEQVLPTEYRVLKDDIVVQKIPYYETTNIQNGLTAYIAEEVK